MTDTFLRMLMAQIVAIAAFFGATQTLAEPAARVDIESQLNIRVVVYQDDIRQFAIWDTVSGSYTVQSDGTVSVPLAGSIIAAGKTTKEIEESVKSALQASSRIGATPDVAVEIAAYRPFYIYGAVARAGAYEAEPGMTVLKAFVLAGGSNAAGATPQRNRERNMAQDSGNLRALMAEMARLKVAAVRISAEIEGVEELTFPADLTHPAGSATLMQLQAEEQAIFESRKLAFELEASAIRKLKQLLTTEIATLEQKVEGVQTQLRLAEEQLGNIETLTQRGLGRASQVANAQTTVIEVQNKELDLQNSIFRAQQELAEADRDLVALETRHASNNAMELQALNAKMEQLEVRRDTLARLLATNNLMFSGTDLPEPVVQFRLAQALDPAQNGMIVEGDYRLKGGEVIEVTLEFEDTGAITSARQ